MYYIITHTFLTGFTRALLTIKCHFHFESGRVHPSFASPSESVAVIRLHERVLSFIQQYISETKPVIALQTHESPRGLCSPVRYPHESAKTALALCGCYSERTNKTN